MAFYAVVLVNIVKDFLFKLILGHCSAVEDKES